MSIDFAPQDYGMKRIIPLGNLRLNTPEDFTVDHQIEWAQEFLDELQDGFTEFEKRCLPEKPAVDIKGSLLKEKDSRYGYTVILTGDLSLTFGTYCVSTGQQMVDHLDVPLNVVFVQANYISRYHLEEETTLFIGGEERELYSYENNSIDLAEVIHEYIYLNKNPYPQKVERPAPVIP